MADKTQFNWVSMLVRFLMALTLVLLTFNPSGVSFFHWIKASLSDLGALQAFVGVVLLIGWVMFIRAGSRSLGALGFILATAFFATLFWLLVEWGVISASNVTSMTWVIEVLLACVLAIGMSWSHIRRRLAGQVDVDEVEEN